MQRVLRQIGKKCRWGEAIRIRLAGLLSHYFLIACLILTPVLLPADDIHHRYFEGLRQRGLYLIAEDYAVNRLNGNRLLLDARAHVTIELALTLTEHGAHANSEQRQELWDEAERLLSEFITKFPENPRILEVQAELALLPARFGDSVAWDFEVNPGNLRSKDAAQQYYQQAVQELARLESTQLSQPSKPSASDLADGALSLNELNELKHKVAYFKASSNLFLALNSVSGPNKAGLLIDVSNQLESLSKSRDASDWTVRAKLLRAKLARLEDDYHRADALLKGLANAETANFLNDEILAEQVRVQLDQDKIASGLKLITDQIAMGKPISDEVRSVAVEGLLAAWKVAGSKGNNELQQELLSEAKGHHEITRGKWHQLTHARILGVQQRLNLGDELAQLIQIAQENYHSGKLKEAVDLFRRAAAVAHRERKQDLAVEYAFTAGSIEIQQQNWSSASSIFNEIIQLFPKHSKASDAGLMKAFAFGQIYVLQPTTESRVNYETALEEIRKQFTGTLSATEATWMLAVHQEQRLQWTDAIELYRDIKPEHPRYDAAMLRIVILYEKILSRLRSVDGPVLEWEDQLVEEIVRIENHFPSGNVLRSLEQCQTSLMVAQLLLQHRDRWYAVADQWLERVARTVDYQRTEASISNTTIDTNWLQVDRAAAQLRIVSLAGQENLQQAREILIELQKTDPTTMLGILLGLTEMTSKIDRRHQVELGHLQQEAINRLSQSRDQLTQQQQDLLDDSHAEAYIAIGNLPEAAEIYESLIQKSPRNERLIRKVIAVLMKRGKAEDVLKARKWWTRVESLHAAGSEEWIESRLEIAKLDHCLGKTDDARKLLGVTLALYPKLGSPELKQHFEEFLSEIKKE